MFFRIVIVCVVLAAAFAVFEIASTWRYYNGVYETKSDFTVKNDGNQSALTIVEFLNYDCLYCRGTHSVLMDYAQTHPDIRVVVRPIPAVQGYAEEAAEMALASGLQGKFWDMDKAIVEYKGKPDSKFYRETANLLDLDYDRLVKDAKGKKVEDMIGANSDAILRSGIKSVPALMVGKTVHVLDKPLTTTDLISMVAAERARKR